MAEPPPQPCARCGVGVPGSSAQERRAKVGFVHCTDCKSDKQWFSLMTLKG